jgi:hypothetical protein
MKIDLISKSWHMLAGKLIKKGERFSVDEDKAKALEKRGRATRATPAVPVAPVVEVKEKRAYKRKDLTAETFEPAVEREAPQPYEFPKSPEVASKERLTTWATAEPVRPVLTRPKAPKE